MSLKVEVDAGWLAKMDMQAEAMRRGAKEGMRDAMVQTADVARHLASWQPDGTDNGRWIVTGMSRATLVGYVAGDDNPFTVTETVKDKYNRLHIPDPSVTGDDGPQDPDQIRGVLTMYMKYSPYLQRWESRQGDPVTSHALKLLEGYIWKTVREHIQRAIAPYL